MSQQESTKKANTKKFPKYGNNLGKEKEFRGKEWEKHNLLNTTSYGTRTPSRKK